MSDSTGTPIDASAGGRLVGEDLQRAVQHGTEQEDRHDPHGGRFEQTRQADHDDHGRDGEVAPGESVFHRRDGTRDGHTRPGFPATHASRSARDRVLITSDGVTHARRAWLIPQRT